MMRRGEGEASFKADGETWTLRFDFNAMADFEGETGQKVFDALEAMEKGTATPAVLRALIWAMLRDHHPDVTLRQAGRIAKQGLQALTAAAMSALPEPDPKDGEGETVEGKPTAATTRAA